MIPRTKVNYTLGHLFRALFITEKRQDHKARLISMLQAYTGIEHVLLTPSGRAGLYFILKAVDKPRVIIPAYTCNAVVEASLLAAKELIRVEIESDGFNMSEAGLGRVVDEKSVVIATHQFGIPCEIEAIQKLCRQRGAFLIEDVAPSLGTRVNGRLTGDFGDAAFFSFDSTKLINVPLKGGFLTVRDPVLFKRVARIYRDEIRSMPLLHKVNLLLQAVVLLSIENHFLYKVFHWLLFQSRGRFTAETSEVSEKRTAFYLYDMADWQAFIAAHQVGRVEELIRARRALHRQLHQKLLHCKGFQLPPSDSASEWACIRFPIRIKGDKFQFYQQAVKRGIDCAFSFTFLACPPQFQIAHKLAAQILDIPFYNKLTDSELEAVVAVLRELGNEGHDES